MASVDDPWRTNHLAVWCMIKIFRGRGVVNGEGVAVKDA